MNWYLSPRYGYVIWVTDTLFDSCQFTVLWMSTVVMKTGIVHRVPELNTFVNLSNNIIPEYAREYKKEYLYIRGLNKINYNLNFSVF